MSKRLATAAALAATCWMAQAAPITESLGFSLGNFVDAFGNAPSPFARIDASFTVTFDPAVTYENDTADLTLDYLTGGFESASALGFSYGSQSHRLRFGGIESNAERVYGGTDDLTVAFDFTDPSHPTFVSCATPGYSCGKFTGNSDYLITSYAQKNAPASIWEATTAQSTVTVLSITAPIPEPSTFMMLAAGSMMLAAARRGWRPLRRRRLPLQRSQHLTQWDLQLGQSK